MRNEHMDMKEKILCSKLEKSNIASNNKPTGHSCASYLFVNGG